jgi:hypothetical protein
MATTPSEETSDCMIIGEVLCESEVRTNSDDEVYVFFGDDWKSFTLLRIPVVKGWVNNTGFLKLGDSVPTPTETALWQLKDWAGDHNRDTMKITDKYKEIKQLVSLEELINLGWEESNKQETTTTKDDDANKQETTPTKDDDADFKVIFTSPGVPAREQLLEAYRITG